jgi:hypothetical protein
MAQNIEPTPSETEIPANPVLDLQAEDSDEVEAHAGKGGNCISVLSVVESGE